MEKIIAVYKLKGPTSNDVLKKIKIITGIKKVGHAGTLDPLAKGVLVVGIGRKATKQLGKIVLKEKEYLATVRLGFHSVTDDAEGAKIKIQDYQRLSRKDLTERIKKMTGKIKQIPPLFSAIKIKGEEAYKLARRGEFVKLKSREVEIKKIKIISYRWPWLKLRIITGPGVYIRSIARDLGGYLFNLERTRVGQFRKESAVTLAKLIDKC